MNKSDLLNEIDELRIKIDALPDFVPVETDVAHPFPITEQLASKLTGFTVDALKGRRYNGEYEQGVVWWNDDHGRVMYDPEELNRIMRCHQRKESTQACRSEAIPSVSASRGKAKRSNGKSTPRLLRLQD